MEYDGQTLKWSLKSAEKLLEKRIDELNALNVYPVPDGDTGINMYLTLKSATNAVEDVSTASVAEVSAKIARGALLGARGNSGVILSQILHGIAIAMEMKERFSAIDFAHAMHHASEVAYRSITKPVEGTILTVIREASEAAMQRAKRGANLKQTMIAITSQAKDTVMRTPELLPKLKEAGVVDAGGKGLLYVFIGIKNFTSRKTQEPGKHEAESPVVNLSTIESGYGFDLQFLVEGDNLPIEEIREKINSMGESVLVVGDEQFARVHVHTQEPQAILNYCSTTGLLKNVNLENMDIQAERFKASVKSGTSKKTDS